MQLFIVYYSSSQHCENGGSMLVKALNKNEVLKRFPNADDIVSVK